MVLALVLLSAVAGLLGGTPQASQGGGLAAQIVGDGVGALVGVTILKRWWPSSC